MKRAIQLTEQQLKRLLDKVVKEQFDDYFDDGGVNDDEELSPELSNFDDDIKPTKKSPFSSKMNDDDEFDDSYGDEYQPEDDEEMGDDENLGIDDTEDAPKIADKIRKDPSILDRMKPDKLAELTPDDIGSILSYHPQFADKLDLSKLDGYNMSKILSKQPSLVDKLDISKMDGKNLEYVVSLQPELKPKLKDYRYNRNVLPSDDFDTDYAYDMNDKNSSSMYEHKKRTIRLTESQLQNLIKQVVIKKKQRR